MNFEELFGIKLSTVIAGIAGGIVSLTFEERLTFKKALLLVFTGGVVAGYSSTLMEVYWQLPDATASAIAFFIGLLSMRIVEFFYLNGPRLFPVIFKRVTGYDAASTNDNEPNSSDQLHVRDAGDNAKV